MENQQSHTSACFTFSLNSVRYGVEALLVQEAVLLPEITPLEEAPPYIIGAVNLRGKAVLVVDLNIRQGGQPERYHLSDSLVIMEQQGTTIGLVVDEILEIINLAADAIDPVPSFGEKSPGQACIIAGIARTDEEMIMLLDKEQLFRFAPPKISSMLPEENPPAEAIKKLSGNQARGRGRYFCAEADEEEKSQFHERAKRLKKPLESQDHTGLMPLAVIELAGEYLGVDLDAVQGFAGLNRLTPIPCCPPHIVGSMNRRGDNLTVADVRALLNMPRDRPLENVMVMHCDNQSVGVSIQEVVDVIHIRPDELRKVPVAISAVDRKYLKGMAPYGERMLVIVDLPKILAGPDLVVDEEL
ncbi:MAG: chemotaxis protein CheW [Gammaproteobacteria bacterium]|nr:chemotaxis protein CheW [Gammaproteobacteria bacterium]